MVMLNLTLILKNIIGAAQIKQESIRQGIRNTCTQQTIPTYPSRVRVRLIIFQNC